MCNLCKIARTLEWHEYSCMCIFCANMMQRMMSVSSCTEQ